MELNAHGNTWLHQNWIKLSVLVLHAKAHFDMNELKSLLIWHIFCESLIQRTRSKQGTSKSCRICLLWLTCLSLHSGTGKLGSSLFLLCHSLPFGLLETHSHLYIQTKEEKRISNRKEENYLINNTMAIEWAMDKISLNANLT